MCERRAMSREWRRDSLDRDFTSCRIYRAFQNYTHRSSEAKFVRGKIRTISNLDVTRANVNRIIVIRLSGTRNNAAADERTTRAGAARRGGETGLGFNLILIGSVIHRDAWPTIRAGH